MKPLYQIYEEKYKEDIEFPGLENKKKKLEDIRNLYKPVYEMGIEHHRRDYEVKKRKIENENKR